ncbi:MAG: hypothetical protein Tsb0015_09490 [Simkaniaceae bacterium]
MKRVLPIIFLLLCNLHLSFAAIRSSSPTTISESITTSNSVMATNDDGTYWTVWKDATEIIQAKFFNGNTFGPKEEITEVGSLTEMAITFVGNEPIVVWIDGGVIRSSLRQNGSWPFPALSIPNTSSATDLAIAKGNNGQTVAVWKEDGQIRSSTFQGDFWTDPVDISNVPAATPLSQPSISTGGDGVSYAVWQQEVAGNPEVFAAFYRGSWSQPLRISAAGEMAGIPVIAAQPASSSPRVITAYPDENDNLLKAVEITLVNGSVRLSRIPMPIMPLMPSSSPVINWGGGTVIIAGIDPSGNVRATLSLEPLAWTTPEIFPAVGFNYADVQAAASSAGNAYILALADSGEVRAAQFARQTWSAAAVISSPGVVVTDMALGIDALGRMYTISSTANGSQAVTVSDSMQNLLYWKNLTNISIQKGS